MEYLGLYLKLKSTDFSVDLEPIYSLVCCKNIHRIKNLLMKKLLLCLNLLLFLSVIAFAQVDEINKQMSLGIQNGYRVSIPGASDKMIASVWKRYTKDYGKLKKNKKADEEYIEAAVVKSIYGSNPMDIYTSVEEGYITAFFDIKSGFLMSSKMPGEGNQAKAFMQEFAFEVQREMVRQELEKEEDVLKKGEKNLEKLKKENIGYHKDIEEAKEKIKKSEANIITNEKDQEQAKVEINNQRTKVKEVQIKLDNIGKSK